MKVGERVPGVRIYAAADGSLSLPEGGYGFDPKTKWWYARPPGDHMGCLRRHKVVEHKDGTISVTPSILITGGATSWHGYLELGVWRRVP